MIRSLTLENYRSFKRFELHDLGRVNLIVGTNNSGKTSLLEAVHILEAAGEYGPIWSALIRRGEDYEETEANRVVRQGDIRRFFHGHEMNIGSRITFDANSGGNVFTAIIKESKPDSQAFQTGPLEAFESQSNGASIPRASALSLHWQNKYSRSDFRTETRISSRGGIHIDTEQIVGHGVPAQRRPVQFVTAASSSSEKVVDLFEEVVLTPYEDSVVEALRIIDPSIERIATSDAERRRFVSDQGSESRSGLVIRCKSVRERIPIGSMVDCIWRLLGLALALAKTAGGILLVDEIDTGLHYGVMEDMWKLVYEAAKKHEIQVFATTHSRDCYESLAAVCRDTVSENSEITIQRVERGKTRSIAYTEHEIFAAAQRGIEVR